ncbi:hypothetical protein AB0M28_18245 [Streptomyces sp. NPDC051940]|uniref:hypothetical protein n=1 Tax=Streptomyces sp. NPDC051940 TaxID=3155675 RepID=UPI00344A4225
MPIDPFAALNALMRAEAARLSDDKARERAERSDPVDDPVTDRGGRPHSPKADRRP